jgi:hypothetical protein
MGLRYNLVSDILSQSTFIRFCSVYDKRFGLNLTVWTATTAIYEDKNTVEMVEVDTD